MHPYLTVGTETVDTVVLRAPGRTVLHTDERGVPVGAAPSRAPSRLPPAEADRRDEARQRLHRPRARRRRARARRASDPDDEAALSLWLDESYRYLELFTGDPLPSVNRRSLAVEPMTCPPNAFRSGEGLLVLEPGESTTGVWGIQP